MRTTASGNRVSKLSIVLLSATAALAYLPIAWAAEDSLGWAYPVNPPDFKPTPDDGTIRHVPGTRAGPGAGSMKDSMSRLDPDDMIAIAAYLGTLKP